MDNGFGELDNAGGQERITTQAVSVSRVINRKYSSKVQIPESDKLLRREPYNCEIGANGSEHHHRYARDEDKNHSNSYRVHFYRIVVMPRSETENLDILMLLSRRHYFYCHDIFFLPY